MNTKYEFTGETKRVNGVTLHRIRALKDFGEIRKGDIGGWIEAERNLSIYIIPHGYLVKHKFTVTLL